MMKKYIQLLAGFLFFIFLGGCANEDDEVQPEESFFRVLSYDADSKVGPKAIMQTSDSGYLILSERYVETSDFAGARLLKVSAIGDFEWAVDLPDNMVMPLGEIVGSPDKPTVICMNDPTLGTHFFQVDVATGELTDAVSFPDYTYPLGATKTSDGGVALQYYDRLSRNTVLVKLNESFTEQWSGTAEVVEDVEEPLFAQMVGHADPLPFFVEEAGDKFLVNGFFNFSMALLQFGNGGNLEGALNGTRFFAGVSSATRMEGGLLAISTYAPFESGRLVGTSINGISGLDNLPIAIVEDWDPKSFPKVLNMQINGQFVALYVVTTRSKEIKLVAYSAVDGTLLGTKYISEGYSYELGDVVVTGDQGIAIGAKTFAAGRLQSVALIKIRKEVLEEMVPESIASEVESVE